MKPNQDFSHLAELLDALDDVLAWMKDRNGKYLWVNRAFLLHFALEHPDGGESVSETQVLGKSDYDLSPAFLADQFRMDDEHVLAGNRIVHRIERVGTNESDAQWNVTHKLPVRDAQGRIIGTAGVTRTMGRSFQQTGATENFGRTLEYMRKHYQRPITNQQLARVANMSLRAFERQFLAAFHLPPQKYLRKLRLRIASRGLINTNQALSELGLACGFADQSHFTREFRRQFGRTPREYREHYRAAVGAFGLNSAAFKQDPNSKLP